VAGLGKPLPLKVGGHNHNGLDHQIPGAFVVSASNARTLPAGVRLALSYSEKLPQAALNEARREKRSASDFQNPVPVDYGAWQEIPLRKEITTAVAEAPRAIGPDARVDLLKIDLRDYFEITRPGTYRLDVTFQAPGQKALPTQHVFYNVVGEEQQASN
jgi:hypothetical protein